MGDTNEGKTRTNRERVKTLGIVILTMMLLFLLYSQIHLQKQNQELKLINSMLQDQQELNQLYQSGDFTSDDWLRRYREMGLRFMNYLCEYGGEKADVKQLMNQYQEYGEAILVISDLLEEADFSAARTHLETVRELADELELTLKAAYEKYQ